MPTEDQPEEEWLNTSSDEERNDGNNDPNGFNISQDLQIQQLKEDKAKIKHEISDPF